MSTVAKVTNGQSSHFYTKTGEPMHFIERSDGKGTRPTTLRDAKKLGLLPSPTSILKVLRAPALEAWLIEQACLAVLTAPRKEGEALDAFVERVLHTERQQDEQAQKARQLGTDIHDAIEQVLNGKPYNPDLAPFVMPAVKEMQQFGELKATEEIVVGDRCAGRLDARFWDNEVLRMTVVDVKTTSNPPQKGSWLEHKLQLSFYAQALEPCEIQTANVYISTVTPGVVVVDVHKDWRTTYENGFKPLLDYWYFSNNYDPIPF